MGGYRGMSAAMALGGRRGGKLAAARIAIQSAASARTHVHVVGRDGQWCVTAHPVGLLYARIPFPASRA